MSAPRVRGQLLDPVHGGPARWSGPPPRRQAGFDAVEFWWPWPVAVPGDAEVDRFVAAVARRRRAAHRPQLRRGRHAGRRPRARLVARAQRRVPRQRRRDGRDRRAAGLPGVQRALRQPGRDDATAEQQDELAAENLAIAARAAEARRGHGAGRAGERRARATRCAPRPTALAAVERAALTARWTTSACCSTSTTSPSTATTSTRAIDARGGPDRARADRRRPRPSPARHRRARPIARWLARISATGYDGWVAYTRRPGWAGA